MDFVCRHGTCDLAFTTDIVANHPEPGVAELTVGVIDQEFALSCAEVIRQTSATAWSRH